MTTAADQLLAAAHLLEEREMQHQGGPDVVGSVVAALLKTNHRGSAEVFRLLNGHLPVDVPTVRHFEISSTFEEAVIFMALVAYAEGAKL